MLADQFRSSPERVGRIRELLQDPTLAAAIVCLKDERPDSQMDTLSGDALVSVRLLNRQIGHDRAIDLFLSLAEPLIVEPPEPQPTWGLKETELVS